jgi:threonyl-tRNA synthetase
MMTQITVTLHDGREKQIPKGTTGLEFIKSELGGGLHKIAMAIKVDGMVKDLKYPLTEDARVEVLTFDDPQGTEAFRHTSSHILAQAVQRLYKDTKLGIGPAIRDGFYYDFDPKENFAPEDLQKIEEEMRKIVKEDLDVERVEMSREEAIEFFKERGEKYKVELIEDLPEDVAISCYRQGEFIDLCAGPHLPSTGRVKAVGLLNLAGAYWRGSEKRPMLQRVYGTSFPKKNLLEDHLHRLEEAKKRDHRRLGQDLGLFSFHDEGPGFPFFHPKGMIIRNELERFWRDEHEKAGYQEIKTPLVLNRVLWEKSGHWDHYKENMYFTKIDEADFAIKPMNCPGGMLIYKSAMHSYRDFPLKLAEMGMVHRHELSGTLHGLMRVRSFTQDDAHIFMLPAQIEKEVEDVINLVDHFYRVFGFKYHVELSTKPEKAMGSDEMWDRATKALENVLIKKEMSYIINEGDGAFYGPKIDFHLEDSLQRTWQCGTIQLDFQMPEKFDLTYIGEDGEKHRPVMIHRVIYGAIERFFALLIEHYAGAFPLWLSPVQAVVLPITDRQHAYAREVGRILKEKGVRTEVDCRSEKVGYKIREAQMNKVPYMLVLGDREVADGSISLRKREDGDLGSFALQDVVDRICQEMAAKS